MEGFTQAALHTNKGGERTGIDSQPAAGWLRKDSVYGARFAFQVSFRRDLHEGIDGIAAIRMLEIGTINPLKDCAAENAH